MEILDNLAGKTDEELALAAVSSQRSFAQIIQRYKLKLFNYIRRISGFGPEEAEDVLQNVF